MNEYTIHLIGAEDDEVAKLLSKTEEEKCNLTLKYMGKTISSDATDFFSAFCEIRKELEKENLIPFCYGASLNVYPSGMCRDMGSGMVAYKMEKGKSTSKESLVPIFEEGTDIIPSTVENQKEYFNEWIESLRT